MSEIDTGTDHLLARVDDGVAVLTMNRPERRNALSGAMLDAMAHVLAAVEVDDDVRCIVLTGAGGAFCAGGDVKGMAGEGGGGGGGARPSFDTAVHRQRLNQRAISGRLYEMPKPTIAALPGAAARAGPPVAAAAAGRSGRAAGDLRDAVAPAVLTTACARVGFAGDYGGTWFLTRLVGSGKARELYSFSERLSAEDAADLGIVNAVFSPADLETETLRLAKRLADGPRVAYRY